MITDITPAHHAQILQMNEEFEYWLSPLSNTDLAFILSRASYARQINDGQGVLIGYADDVDYPDHQNLTWLKEKLTRFIYIDRVIVAATSQGLGLGQRLYNDVEVFARENGFKWLTCEVNTLPDNPASHQFHQRAGFHDIGERSNPTSGKAVRYYAKAL